MNGNVNMREKLETSFKNNRDVVGNMPYRSPDVENMGMLAGHQRMILLIISM